MADRGSPPSPPASIKYVNGVSSDLSSDVVPGAESPQQTAPSDIQIELDLECGHNRERANVSRVAIFQRLENIGEQSTT